MARSISPAGFALVQSFEGFRAEPLRLGDGRYLIGHGHVRSGPPEAPISESEAARLLRLDLGAAEAVVGDRALVHLETSQFDALVSFAFSIGPDVFAESEALRRLNAGDWVGCAEAMRAWRFAAGESEPQALQALARRRAVEIALLLDSGPRAGAPSALVRPQIGAAAQTAQPIADRLAPELDELTERLRRILAAEPSTARALEPPPPPLEEEEEPLPPSNLPSAAPQREATMLRDLAEDRVALSALALAGVVLILIGFGLRAGLGGAWGNGVAALLAAPGGALSLGAAYLLLAPLMRTR